MSKYNKISINKEEYYTIQKIKNRVVTVPSCELKKKQKYFMNAIKWIYPIKQSTVETAKIHLGKKWILKMDIKDFFSSVPFDDIQNVIINVLKYCNKEDEFINHIILTTINNKLPVGAPTSPYLANACFVGIDKTIKNICYLYEVNYSRYVDDLIFSSNYIEDLNLIEKRIKDVLNYHGYKINPKKTKYISDNKQQNVLGLVINDNKIRLSKAFKRKIRAMIHSKYNKKDLKYLAWNINSEYSLNGYLNYIKNVDKEFYLKLKCYQAGLSKKYS